MQIDVSTIIKDLEGKPIQVQKDDQTWEVLTLKKCLLDLCGASRQHEQLGGEEKLTRFKVGLKLAEATTTITLTPEDIVKLKELSKLYSTTIVMGRILEVLEPTAFDKGAGNGTQA